MSGAAEPSRDGAVAGESIRRSSVQEWLNNMQDADHSGGATSQPGETVPVAMETGTAEDGGAAADGKAEEHDDLDLGAEAKMMNGEKAAQPATQITSIMIGASSSPLRKISGRPSVNWEDRFGLAQQESFDSSDILERINSILQQRTGDPEEILTSLGFGSVDSNDSLPSRIPERFLTRPSSAQGISLTDFLDKNPELKEYVNYRNALSQPSQSVSSSGDEGIGAPIPGLKFHQAALVSSFVKRFRRNAGLHDHKKPAVETHVGLTPSGKRFNSILHPDNTNILCQQGAYEDTNQPTFPRKSVIENTNRLKLKLIPEQSRWSCVLPPCFENPPSESGRRSISPIIDGSDLRRNCSSPDIVVTEYNEPETRKRSLTLEPGGHHHKLKLHIGSSGSRPGSPRAVSPLGSPSTGLLTVTSPYLNTPPSSGSHLDSPVISLFDSASQCSNGSLPERFQHPSLLLPDSHIVDEFRDRDSLSQCSNSSLPERFHRPSVVLPESHICDEFRQRDFGPSTSPELSRSNSLSAISTLRRKSDTFLNHPSKNALRQDGMNYLNVSLDENLLRRRKLSDPELFTKSKQSEMSDSPTDDLDASRLTHAFMSDTNYHLRDVRVDQNEEVICESAKPYCDIDSTSAKLIDASPEIPVDVFTLPNQQDVSVETRTLETVDIGDPSCEPSNIDLTDVECHDHLLKSKHPVSGNITMETGTTLHAGSQIAGNLELSSDAWLGSERQRKISSTLEQLSETGETPSESGHFVDSVIAKNDDSTGELQGEVIDTDSSDNEHSNLDRSVSLTKDTKVDSEFEFEFVGSVNDVSVTDVMTFTPSASVDVCELVPSHQSPPPSPFEAAILSEYSLYQYNTVPPKDEDTLDAELESGRIHFDVSHKAEPVVESLLIGDVGETPVIKSQNSCGAHEIRESDESVCKSLDDSVPLLVEKGDDTIVSDNLTIAPVSSAVDVPTAASRRAAFKKARSSNITDESSMSNDANESLQTNDSPPFSIQTSDSPRWTFFVRVYGLLSCDPPLLPDEKALMLCDKVIYTVELPTYSCIAGPVNVHVREVVETSWNQDQEILLTPTAKVSHSRSVIDEGDRHSPRASEPQTYNLSYLTANIGFCDDSEVIYLPPVEFRDMEMENETRIFSGNDSCISNLTADVDLYDETDVIYLPPVAFATDDAMETDADQLYLSELSDDRTYIHEEMLIPPVPLQFVKSESNSVFFDIQRENLTHPVPPGLNSEPETDQVPSAGTDALFTRMNSVQDDDIDDVIVRPRRHTISLTNLNLRHDDDLRDVILTRARSHTVSAPGIQITQTDNVCEEVVIPRRRRTLTLSGTSVIIEELRDEIEAPTEIEDALIPKNHQHPLLDAITEMAVDATDVSEERVNALQHGLSRHHEIGRDLGSDSDAERESVDSSAKSDSSDVCMYDSEVSEEPCVAITSCSSISIPIDNEKAVGFDTNAGISESLTEVEEQYTKFPVGLDTFTDIRSLHDSKAKENIGELEHSGDLFVQTSNDIAYVEDLETQQSFELYVDSEPECRSIDSLPMSEQDDLSADDMDVDEEHNLHEYEDEPTPVPAEISSREQTFSYDLLTDDLKTPVPVDFEHKSDGQTFSYEFLINNDLFSHKKSDMGEPDIGIIAESMNSDKTVQDIVEFDASIIVPPLVSFGEQVESWGALSTEDSQEPASRLEIYQPQHAVLNIASTSKLTDAELSRSASDDSDDAGIVAERLDVYLHDTPTQNLSIMQLDVLERTSPIMFAPHSPTLETDSTHDASTYFGFLSMEGNSHGNSSIPLTEKSEVASASLQSEFKQPPCDGKDADIINHFTLHENIVLPSQLQNEGDYDGAEMLPTSSSSDNTSRLPETFQVKERTLSHSIMSSSSSSKHSYSSHDSQHDYVTTEPTFTTDQLVTTETVQYTNVIESLSDDGYEISGACMDVDSESESDSGSSGDGSSLQMDVMEIVSIPGVSHKSPTDLIAMTTSEACPETSGYIRDSHTDVTNVSPSDDGASNVASLREELDSAPMHQELVNITDDRNPPSLETSSGERPHLMDGSPLIMITAPSGDLSMSDNRESAIDISPLHDADIFDFIQTDNRAHDICENDLTMQDGNLAMIEVCDHEIHISDSNKEPVCVTSNIVSVHTQPPKEQIQIVELSDQESSGNTSFSEEILFSSEEAKLSESIDELLGLRFEPSSWTVSSLPAEDHHHPCIEGHHQIIEPLQTQNQQEILDEHVASPSPVDVQDIYSMLDHVDRPVEALVQSLESSEIEPGVHQSNVCRGSILEESLIPQDKRGSWELDRDTGDLHGRTSDLDPNNFHNRESEGMSESEIGPGVHKSNVCQGSLLEDSLIPQDRRGSWELDPDTGDLHGITSDLDLSNLYNSESRGMPESETSDLDLNKDGNMNQLISDADLRKDERIVCDLSGDEAYSPTYEYTYLTEELVDADSEHSSDDSSVCFSAGELKVVGVTEPAVQLQSTAHQYHDVSLRPNQDRTICPVAGDHTPVAHGDPAQLDTLHAHTSHQIETGSHHEFLNPDTDKVSVVDLFTETAEKSIESLLESQMLDTVAMGNLIPSDKEDGAGKQVNVIWYGRARDDSDEDSVADGDGGKDAVDAESDQQAALKNKRNNMQEDISTVTQLLPDILYTLEENDKNSEQGVPQGNLTDYRPKKPPRRSPDRIITELDRKRKAMEEMTEVASFELEEIQSEDTMGDDLPSIPPTKPSPTSRGVLVRTGSAQSDSSGFAEADPSEIGVPSGPLDWQTLKIAHLDSEGEVVGDSSIHSNQDIQAAVAKAAISRESSRTDSVHSCDTVRWNSKLIESSPSFDLEQWTYTHDGHDSESHTPKRALSDISYHGDISSHDDDSTVCQKVSRTSSDVYFSPSDDNIENIPFVTVIDVLSDDNMGQGQPKLGQGHDVDPKQNGFAPNYENEENIPPKPKERKKRKQKLKELKRKEAENLNAEIKLTNRKIIEEEDNKMAVIVPPSPNLVTKLHISPSPKHLPNVSLSHVSELFIEVDDGQIKEVKNLTETDNEADVSIDWCVEYGIHPISMEYDHPEVFDDSIAGLKSPNTMDISSSVENLSNVSLRSVNCDSSFAIIETPETLKITTRPRSLQSEIDEAELLQDPSHQVSCLHLTIMPTPAGTPVPPPRYRKQRHEINVNGCAQHEVLSTMLKHTGAWDEKLESLPSREVWRESAAERVNIDYKQYLLDQMYLLQHALQKYKNEFEFLTRRSNMIFMQEEVPPAQRSKFEDLFMFSEAITEEINLMDASLEERIKALKENTDEDGGATFFMDLSSLNILREMIELLKEQVYHGNVVTSMEVGIIGEQEEAVAKEMESTASGDKPHPSLIPDARSLDLMAQLTTMQHDLLEQQNQAAAQLTNSIKEEQLSAPGLSTGGDKK